MAELVGLVASSLTLAEVAVRAGGAVSRLRTLWEEIQNVPQVITNLMRRIDIADAIIWEMEKEMKEHDKISPMIFNDTAMRSSLELCRQALDDLVDLADDLRSQIDTQKGRRGVKRGVAKFKVCLKKEALADYERRLQNAFSLLCAAQQCYMNVKLRFLPHVIVQNLRQEQYQMSGGTLYGTEHSEESAPWSPPPFQKRKPMHPEPERRQDTIHKNEEGPIYKSKDRFQPLPWYESSFLGHITTRRKDIDQDTDQFGGTSWSFRFQLPSWIATKAWDIQMDKAISGWNIRLRTWCSVDYCSSDAFTAVKSRSPLELRQLLHGGLASPFERDQKGLTLLHYVTDTECAEILVGAGLEFGERDFDDRTALSHILMKHTHSPRAIPEIKAFMSAYRIFDEAPDHEESSWVIQNYANRIWRGRSFYPQMPLTLDRVFSGYHKLPIATRVREFFASPGNRYVEGIAPEVFLHSLWPDGRVRKDDIMQLHSHGLPFMNIVSAWIGFRSWSWWTEEPLEWRETLQEVLDITGDLHTFRHDDICKSGDFWYLRYQTTPLICFVLGAAVITIKRKRKLKEDISWAIKGWLSLLESCNVNLIRYGRRERKALRKNHELTETRLDQLVRNGERPCGESGCLKLKDIQYANSPEDWCLVWDLDVEEFAGEFWQMAEEPRFPIPGAWVDD